MAGEGRRAWWLAQLRLGERYIFQGEQLPYGTFRARVRKIDAQGVWLDIETFSSIDLTYISGERLATASAH